MVTRRNAITMFATMPLVAAAQVDANRQAEIDQRNLVAAMVNFDESWTDFVNDFVAKKGEVWDMKGAANVEREFKRMITQPGWISAHKV